MKKKYASMFVGLLMAVVFAFPVMAAEAVTDVSGGDVADASEIAILTAEIPEEETEEQTVFMADVQDEDDVTAVNENTEEVTVYVYDGDSEEITEDTPAGDTEEAVAEISAEDAIEDADAADEAEPADDGVMLLSTSDPEEDEDGEISVTGVSLNKSKLTIRSKDQTLQLTATVKPSDATDPSVAWSSSDTKVVTVDKDGKLTAVKDGTATITVTTTDGEYTADCAVTVSLYSDGFHQDPDGTDWCYYKNGKIATGTTDIIQGTVNGKSGYWNVVKGRVAASATVVQGTVDGTTAWWYVNKKGIVDTSYTGFATNSSGTWYVEKGKVNKKTNGVLQDTTGALGSSSAWYYVLNSKVQYDFTGLADYSNASGWWYITNGKVDRSVTTVAKNKNGWWYVANGKVNKSYTGFGTNSSGSWYVEKGKVTKKVNGVYKDSTGAIGSKSAWYYVLNSKVQTGFTGLADYSNASGWWYITKGKVDRSYNGLAKNKNGWYYVKNGKVDTSFTGTAQNSNGWWYVENGKVDKSVVALVRVDGVYQAYKNGKFDSSYTGIAENENGMWYVENGVLDRTYSGIYSDDSGTWTVVNGKATFSGEKGWVKIGSYYYYFDRSTGRMAKDTTVDGIKLDSSGKAQTSSDDVYKIKTMINARELMESITKTSDSQSEKLKKCYSWAAGMSSNRIRYFSQTRRNYPNTWTAVYANDGISSKSGTCVTTACTFAYLAKECGYSSVYVLDTNVHAWVEIDGLYYDPDMGGPGYYNQWYANTESIYKYNNRTEI